MKFLKKNSTPKFIAQFDAYLLKRFPFLWASKIHKLLFYAPVLALLLCAFVKILPIDYDYFPISADNLFIINCLVVSILVIYWLRTNTIFSFVKQHGRFKDIYFLLTPLIFFIVALIFLSVVLTPYNLYLNKIKNTYIGDELYHYLKLDKVDLGLENEYEFAVNVEKNGVYGLKRLDNIYYLSLIHI